MSVSTGTFVPESEFWIDTSGHDYASPSKLELCALCPGYPRLARATERMSLGNNEAARRGTDLHEYAVQVLTGKTTYEALALVLAAEDLEQLKWAVERTKEIIERFPTGIVQYEIQIDLSSLGISGGAHGSRIDVLIVVPGVGLVVVDWKFGRVWVTPPEWNWQFKAYAWGASNQFGGSVEAILLQPQSPEGRDYMQCVYTPEDLQEAGESIKAIVAATRKEDAPLVRGEHCKKKWCSMYSVCPMYKSSPLDVPSGVDIPTYVSLLQPIDRGILYDTVLAAESLIKKFKETCIELAVEHGIEFGNGFGVGPGRSSYVCGDVPRFVETLRPFAAAKGVEVADLLTPPIPPTPKSKSDVEKIIGKSKAAQDAVKSLYVEVPGKPTLKKLKT
jgi:hypothetical protein